MLIEKINSKMAGKGDIVQKTSLFCLYFQAGKKTRGVISGSLTISPISAGGVKRGAAIRKI